MKPSVPIRSSQRTTRKDTEGHPGVGELDLIVGGHAPGEVRKTHHVSAHAPFLEMAATSCGMPVDISKLLIHQPTQLLQGISL